LIILSSIDIEPYISIDSWFDGEGRGADAGKFWVLLGDGGYIKIWSSYVREMEKWAGRRKSIVLHVFLVMVAFNCLLK